MQVLYFLPAFREAMLAHVPSPDREFSLMGEVALLFRMLFSAQSEACQVGSSYPSTSFLTKVVVKVIAGMKILLGLNIINVWSHP